MPTTTSGGTTTSFTNAPQATDDAFSLSEDFGITYFDVMLDDLGGKAKTLWSIDDTTQDGTTGESGTANGTIDLLTQDLVGVCNYSDSGARIWITADGRIGYSAGNIFNYLAEGQFATDSFTYAIRLANGTLSWATVTVTITGTNDAPEVSDVSASADEDGAAVTGSFAGDDVDSDDDGASLTYTITSDPDEGSVVNNGDGTFSFDPGDDFQDLADGETREVTFTYTATDSHDETSNSGTVTVTVTGTNDAPELTGTQAALADGTEDTGYVVAAADLLAGFTDVDGGTLAVDGLTADHGSVTNNGDGTYTITPTANHNGAVVLTYSVVDGQGGSTAATQSFDLAAVNDAAAITGAASGSITEDAVPNTVGGNLDSTDVDNPDDSWTAVTTATASANGYGTYTIDAAGNWVYTLTNANPTVNALNNGGTLADSFTVVTVDGTSQVVNITINGHSDVTDVLAPTDIKFSLAPTVGNLTGGSIGSGVSLGSFTAVDGDSTSWSFALSGADAALFTVTPSTGGTVNLVTGAGGLSTNKYTFTVTATDGGGNSYFETFNVSVGSVSGDGAVSFTVSNSSDVSFGLNGGDTINGGSGEDALVGGNGTDTLNGGLGNDQLFGGAQDDIFVFNTTITGSPNVDDILDFNANNADKIHLDDAIFAGIGTGGVLAAADFVANIGGNATTATQNILYDTATGNLYYDPDGTGAAAKILFAHLTVTGGTVDASDFLVI